jgi:formate hydrogenlyase subunit 4
VSWALAGGQVAAYALLAPLFVGLLQWLQARLQGRRGADPVQPYRNLRKLAGKRANVPASASGPFRLAPPVVFTCFLLLGFALPAFARPARSGMDLLLVVALLGLAKFAGALAAFDSAAPFGPMSSSRQLFVHMLVQPALMLVIYVLTLHSHTSSLAGLTAPLPGAGALLADPVIAVALGALAYVLLAELGRLPFDNPTTHLELTMIEQGSRLEYSGVALAMMEWADAMRTTFALSLLAALAVPWGMVDGQHLQWLPLAVLGYVGKVCVLLFLLALWEVHRAKIRLRAVVLHVMLPMGALLFAVVSVVLATNSARGR